MAEITQKRSNYWYFLFKQSQEFFPRYLGLREDPGQEIHGDLLVDGHSQSSPIGMAQEYVTCPLSNDLKPELAEQPD